MAETIQKQTTRSFLEHAATLYGVSLPPEVLDDLAGCDNFEALVTAFPSLSDAELDEALWALGRFRD